MTPYSAAAGGSFSRRASSRSRRLLRVLGQLERLEPLAQLVDLRLLGVALAELVLDRLQLLAEEELALALLHLRLDLRLDLRPELQDLELSVQDRRDRAQPLLDVHELEQALLLLRLDAHRRGDEVAERARILDVRGGELQLLGQVRHERDHAGEEVLDVARQRLDLARLDRARPAAARTPPRGTAPRRLAGRGGCARRPGRGFAASRRARGSACGRSPPCRCRRGRRSRAPPAHRSSPRRARAAARRRPRRRSA